MQMKSDVLNKLTSNEYIHKDTLSSIAHEGNWSPYGANNKGSKTIDYYQIKHQMNRNNNAFAHT